MFFTTLTNIFPHPSLQKFVLVYKKEMLTQVKFCKSWCPGRDPFDSVRTPGTLTSQLMDITKAAQAQPPTPQASKCPPSVDQISGQSHAYPISTPAVQCGWGMLICGRALLLITLRKFTQPLLILPFSPGHLQRPDHFWTLPALPGIGSPQASYFGPHWGLLVRVTKIKQSFPGLSAQALDLDSISQSP